MRNATVTTIAPTGSISIIAGCSSGIEPIFAISFIRNVLGGTRLFETNPLFEIMAKERGFYSAELLEGIAKTGSAQKIEAIPEDVKKIFVTALDIQPEWHVRMQAAFQKYTDNAVSKTVNLPNEARVEDVRKVYELAWKLKCKGVTVFRYGSKPEQVLYIGEIKTKETKFVSAESEYAGGCPTKTCPFPS
jgi:ribonucleoside-diphosphate reductase alpha chain